MVPEEPNRRLCRTNARSASATPRRETACELRRGAGPPFRRVEARDRHPRHGGVLHDLLAALLPWAGLLGLSTMLAWAMNVGVTDGAHAPAGLSSPQSLPLVADAPPAVVDDVLGVDEALAPRKFRTASKVLTITVEGPNGPYAVRCVTTTERALFDAVSVRTDQLMDLFHELCSPQPSSS